MDPKYWNQIFSTEVSARYHEWRHGTLGLYVSMVRGVSLFGSVLALLTAIAAPSYALGAIFVVSAIVATVNLVDLVWNFDARARLHHDLYRRFKRLQERMARDQENWSEHIAEWEGEAQAIRQDEPPTLWAVYAMCWNQTIEKFGAERRGHEREITEWRYRLRNLCQFRPHNFPEKGAQAT